MKCLLSLSVVVLGSLWGAGPQAAVAGPLDGWHDVAVNAEGRTYDSEASLAVSPDGGAWIAWHAYRTGRDRIMARRLDPEAPGPVHELTTEGNAHGPPVVVAESRQSAWAFWPARLGDRWQILGRHVVGRKAQPAVTLSDDNAIFVSAAISAAGRVVVSWSAYREGRFRVWCRVLAGSVWQRPVALSPEQHDAFRSAIAADGHSGAWVFWDAYGEGKYAVWGRQLEPEPGPPEQISPPGRNCLVPVAISAGPGVCVAWLEVADVIGGEGAITQWHTLAAAVRHPEGWKTVTDAQGNTAGATLTHGLIHRIEPEPVATGGYMGRRRRPMLLADGPGAWLLWERKRDHRGRTPNSTGQLVGRRFEHGQWQPPVVLHQGYVDYHVPGAGKIVGGKFLVVASELPRNLRRIYHATAVDVDAPVPFEQEDWPGWRPVELPLEEEIPRHEIRHGGRVYNLYWADLHCHSGLTPDAEGEPDELLYYARDRARLDVVAMTQNDFIYDAFFTEGQFALDHFLAGCFTRPGEFLVLPGYEWTSRLPRSDDMRRADPRNWDSQHLRLSYPNHRSVIYPPAGGPVVRHPEVENDIRRLNQTVQAAGGVTLTQHATWELTGDPCEVGVEVTSGWGIYIEDPTRVHDALNEGYRFGLVGNGDSHRRNPGLCGGLTGIYAESLWADAILNALKSRRVYATNGSRIVLDSRANGSLMGSETECPDGNVEITLRAVGSRPIVAATLIRDGGQIVTFDGDGRKDLTITHRDQGLSPGTHWYYWRIVQQGAAARYPGNLKVARGQLAWSSPHWVVVKPSAVSRQRSARPEKSGKLQAED